MKIHINPSNPSGRHSGEGRNPAEQITLRSRQNQNAVPLKRELFKRLDSGLRRNDEEFSIRLSGVKRYSACLGLAALLLAPTAWGEPENSSATLGMDDAVTLALSGNPSLAAMQARARALAEVPSQVGTLPDPTLTLGLLSVPTDTYSLSQEAMTQSQIGIGFTLPFPGKLGLREQVAELEAETANNDADEKRLVLVRNVRSTWWNLFYLEHALAIVQRNRNLLRQFVSVAETKYKTGLGMQSDVLLAQVELSKLLDTELAVQALRRSQASTLNALLGRSANIAIALPSQADETLPPAPDSASLIKLAAEKRPLIVSRRNTVSAANGRTQLAEKDIYPDLRLGAAYGFRRDAPNGIQRADLASITLNLNLPLFAGSRQDKAVSQRRAEAQKEEYNLRDAELQVENEIEQALAEYLAAREQASLYKTGIIPQSSQTASSMLAAYQVNKVDFLNLVRAQINLYNNENQYWKTISTGWQAWARLESAVGTPLATGNKMETRNKSSVRGELVEP